MPNRNDQHAQFHTPSDEGPVVPKSQRSPKTALPQTVQQQSDHDPQTADLRPVVPKSQRSPESKKRIRPWVKVRLPDNSLDVERIVANWTAERKAAPKLAEAIRLLDAFEAGNLDYVRENYPLLAEALQKSKKRNMTPPLKESYKERESEPEEKRPEVELLATALYEATGSDPHLNPAVYDLATQLHKMNYTADDVRLWHRKCWPKDWRGKKGDWPALKDVRDLIGQVRSVPVDEPEQNPYLADPFFARATDDEPEAPAETAPEWPPAACSVPIYIQTWWLAAMGQFQIQLNRATYDTWLKHAKPVHFAGNTRGGVIYVAVGNHHSKDWIDHHFLHSLNQLLDNLLNKEYVDGRYKRISEQPAFSAEIIVEGDPVPGVSDA